MKMKDQILEITSHCTDNLRITVQQNLDLLLAIKSHKKLNNNININNCNTDNKIKILLEIVYTQTHIEKNK